MCPEEIEAGPVPSSLFKEPMTNIKIDDTAELKSIVFDLDSAGVNVVVLENTDSNRYIFVSLTVQEDNVRPLILMQVS